LHTDLEELRKLGYDVEAAIGPKFSFVTFRKFPLPEGLFTARFTDLLVIVPAPYPKAALDMFYIQPDIMLRRGFLPKASDVLHSLNQRIWRRISWHRNTAWGPRDDLLTYIEFCRQRFIEVINE
jgi:hypothetical protein